MPAAASEYLVAAGDLIPWPMWILGIIFLILNIRGQLLAQQAFKRAVRAGEEVEFEVSPQRTRFSTKGRSATKDSGERRLKSVPNDKDSA